MLDTNKTNISRQNELIDIKKYLNILNKYRTWLILITLSAAIIAVIAAISITPIYRATSVLLIDNQQPNIVSVEDVMGIDTSQQEYHQTQYQVLRSNRIAERVISTLNLSALPEFSGEGESPGLIDQIKQKVYSIELLQPYLPAQPVPTAEQKQTSIEHRVLGRFKERLTVTPIKQTRLVNVSFESQDPQLAAQVANEVGTAYINSILEARISVTNDASGWLGDRLTELKQQLEDSEQALTDYLKQEGLVDLGAIGGIDSLASSELSDLTSRIAAANERRIAAEATASQLRSSRNSSSISEISRHPQMRDIRMAQFEAERNVSELSNRYGPKHDRMVQAQAQLQATRRSANALLNQLLAEQDKERQAALQQERSLKQMLAEKKREYQQLTIKEAEFNALKREVESNRQLYDTFLTRQKETNASGKFDSVNASFSDVAIAPQQPVKPNKSLIVGLATIMSALCSMSVVLLFEALSDTIEKPEDVESKLGLTLLGSVPLVKSRRLGSKALDSDLYFDPKHHPYTEAIRSIRTTLQLNAHRQHSKLITLTSAIPGEGKTTTSLNLAISLAGLGKVLLIDTDLRSPSVGERFGLDPKHPGVSNILVSGTAIEECIYRDEKSGLDVLPAGLLVPNPQELLSSKKLETLLETVQNHYDKVVVDTPPCQAVSDALLIARQTGSVELVVHAGSTKVNLVKSTISKLINCDINIGGVILNQVEKKHSDLYSYYDGYSNNYQKSATVHKISGQ